MEAYDLCVIGGGPSGYAAAMRALDLGKRVLLVEKDRLGGAGIHHGALSSKTFWEIAEDLSSARAQAARYGVSLPDIPFAGLQQEVEAAVSRRREQLESNAAALRKRGLDLVYGHAHLISPTEVAIDSSGERQIVQAQHTILATGSRPRTIPSVQIDEQIILSSDGIANLKDYPESMVILGAGVIGCEFATIFALLGRTRVCLIDKSDRILPFEDEDVVQVVEKSLVDHGVCIHRKSRMLRLEAVDGEVEYELEYQDGHREVFRVEKALVAIGRVPNTEGLGLSALGLNLSPRGHLHDAGKDTCTSLPNIYAVGDITADIALVNVGEMEGRYAVEKMFGEVDHELCYDNISTIMFVHPEVAGVGLNELQARKAGIAYRVACVGYSTIVRAIAMRTGEGFFKVLVSDDEEMRLLGMRAVGRQASAAIQAVAVLISMGKGIHELADCIHPHPSIVEGVQECVRMLLGKPTFKPDALPDHLRCGRYCQGKWEDLA